MRSLLVILSLPALSLAASSINVTTPSSSTWTADTSVDFDVTITDAAACYGFIDWNSSLIGWWKFDGDATDSSVTANDGTAVGTVTYDAGKFGSRMLCGADSYVTIPDHDAYWFFIGDSFTISFWVYSTDDGSKVVFHKGDGCLRMRRYGTEWRFQLGDLALNYEQGVTTDTWTHLLLVYNGSTHTATMYADGTQRGSGEVTTFRNEATSTTFPNITPIIMGGTTFYVDEFLWFNRAIDANEVSHLYNGKGGDLVTSLAGTEMSSYAYTIHAVSADGSDTTNAVSSPIKIDVPNTGPIITLTLPGDNLRDSTTTQTFTATVAIGDTGTTLTQATLWANWGGGDVIQIGDADVLSGTSDTASFVVNSIGTGTWSWKMQATDSAKTTSNSSTYTLRIGQDTWYISDANGNDSTGDGTIGTPWKTIQKFADQCYPGDTCVIEEGTYRETVTPVRGGFSDANIVFMPHGSETVTISGADVVGSGSWTVHSGNIYKTTLMNWDLGRGDNQVFHDGTMMIEARNPDVLGNDVMTPQFWTPSGTECNVVDGVLSIRDGDLLSYDANYWNGGTVHGVWDTRYHAQTAIVTASVGDVDHGHLTATMDNNPGWRAANEGDFDASFYYITGHLASLDSAYEWYYDTATTTLYLWTPDSTTPSDNVVEAKARDVAFDLDGLSYIELRDLYIRSANITTDDSSHYNLFNGLNCKYLSHYGVLSSGDLGDGQFGVRTTGIVINGTYNIVRDCTIDYSAGNGVSLNGNYCQVVGCTITNCNYMCTGCAAVAMGSTGGEGYSAAYNTITRNTISKTGRNGIVHTMARYSTITRNDISYTNYGDEVVDLGGVYCIATNGMRGDIAYNRIHDISGFGIYLDNGCSNFDVHHNLTFALVSTDITASNLGILTNPATTDHYIYNNTFVAGEIRLGGFAGSTVGNIVANNIASAISDYAGNGGTETTNLESELYTDIYTNYAGGDYTLKAGSPAINAGTDLGSDYDDALRTTSTWPSGVVLIDMDITGSAGWDQGAYAYGTSPTSNLFGGFGNPPTTNAFGSID